MDTLTIEQAKETITFLADEYGCYYDGEDDESLIKNYSGRSMYGASC